MNYESQIANLREELLAIKSAFNRNGADLIIYNYTLSFTATSGNVYTLTFVSDDGSDTIATVTFENGRELQACRRIPYSGGARWYLFPTSGVDEPSTTTRTITVRSIRKGSLQIS